MNKLAFLQKSGLFSNLFQVFFIAYIAVSSIGFVSLKLITQNVHTILFLCFVSVCIFEAVYWDIKLFKRKAKIKCYFFLWFLLIACGGMLIFFNSYLINNCNINIAKLDSIITALFVGSMGLIVIVFSINNKKEKGYTA